MFESHLGFRGPPFQLSPDPSFYFESKGHGNALAYLKFGVHQREGFIVVTGEIGAGKTTLVRTLLQGIGDDVVAAQIVNTQLECKELLQSICAAFGIPIDGNSKAQWISRLEAFLIALAATGRRALLIVDEAQNLGPREIEELRMLSNFQLDNQALLQSFLVGQPELRHKLRSDSLEQLRQRVIASCHLGPLNADEVQGYVEHRLRHVGWKGVNPAFAPDAFQRVYEATGGVPRRINVLCNRLLLSYYLRPCDPISSTDVSAIANELRVELNESVGPSNSLSAL